VNPPKTSLSIFPSPSDVSDVDDVFLSLDGGGCDAQFRAAAA
jgi:hypothetical protein